MMTAQKTHFPHEERKVSTKALVLAVFVVVVWRCFFFKCGSMIFYVCLVKGKNRRERENCSNAPLQFNRKLYTPLRKLCKHLAAAGWMVTATHRPEKAYVQKKANAKLFICAESRRWRQTQRSTARYRETPPCIYMVINNHENTREGKRILKICRWNKTGWLRQAGVAENG